MRTTTETSAPADLAGKYLTFRLEQESYGIRVLQVREIIRLASITPVPKLPDYVRGVINLRGKIIPVLDVRIKFGLGTPVNSERACIIVVSLSDSNSLVGLAVDAVEEVGHFAADDIEPPPDFGVNVETRYILGLAKVKNTVKTLLNIDRLFGTDASVVAGAAAGE